MTELKTLKDLHFIAATRGDKKMWCTETDELKKEAIKWVKFIDESAVAVGGTAGNFYQRDWIKHFFNITEEDLNG